VADTAEIDDERERRFMARELEVLDELSKEFDKPIGFFDTLAPEHRLPKIKALRLKKQARSSPEPS